MSLHYKKDGSLDMRYSSSKAAVSGGCGTGGRSSYSGASYSQPSVYGGSYALPCNRTSSASDLHYKKDGSLDMRYSSSKAAVSGGCGTGGRSSYSGASYSQPSVYGGSYALPHDRTSSASDLHYKKDGSLDMRYNSSRQAMAGPSSSYSGQTSMPPHASGKSLNVNYYSSKQSTDQLSMIPENSGNLHYKKDGTLDMRYKSSKLAVGGLESQLKAMSLSSSSAHPQKSAKRPSAGVANVYDFPAEVPLKKNGTPDMRKAEAKRWVQQQADAYARGKILPQWVPTKKDGTISVTDAIGRMFARVQPVSRSSEASSIAHRRQRYYDGRKMDVAFRELLGQERAKVCPLPPPANLLPAPTYSLSEISSRSGKQNSVSASFNVPANAKEIDYSSIRFQGDVIGKGAFGVVQKASWNGFEVAVKILHLSQLTRKEKADFEKEICILAVAGEHKNLVYLHGYCIVPPCIVMELVERGSLSNLLHYCTDPEVEVTMTDGRVKRTLMCGVAEGMHQLHVFKIIHGDLKPQNILITSDYTAKITDFGLSTLRGKTSSSLRSKDVANDDDDECHIVGGTAGYMAPELLDSTSPPDYSADVYSFGIVLNEVIAEEEPYSDQYQNFAGRGPFAATNYARLGKRPTINRSITSRFVEELIVQCWSPDPARRPTFQKILTFIRDARFQIVDTIVP